MLFRESAFRKCTPTIASIPDMPRIRISSGFKTYVFGIFYFLPKKTLSAPKGSWRAMRRLAVYKYFNTHSIIYLPDDGGEIQPIKRDKKCKLSPIHTHST